MNLLIKNVSDDTYTHMFMGTLSRKKTISFKIDEEKYSFNRLKKETSYKIGHLDYIVTYWKKTDNVQFYVHYKDYKIACLVGSNYYIFENLEKFIKDIHNSVNPLFPLPENLLTTEEQMGYIHYQVLPND